MPQFQHIEPPKTGTPITADAANKLHVPNDPIIPFIEGDGTGRDIWRASKQVFDAGVEKAFGNEKKIHWFQIHAGEFCKNNGFGDEKYNGWISDDTFSAIAEYKVAIKGPLTTPVGGGIRSLNVMLRQVLNLYACYRPVYWLDGVPSPVRAPQNIDFHIFRENTEDVYAGLEWKEGSDAALKLIEFINTEIAPMAKDTANKKILIDSGIGVKPISHTGCERLQKMALQFALEHPHPDRDRNSITWMHKGNIMKYTEGFFKNKGYEVADKFFRNTTVSERESWILGNREAGITDPVANAKQLEPGFDMLSEDDKKAAVAEVETALKLWDTHGDGKWKNMLMVKDRIADSIFQQILTRPQEYYIICTPNLNGDYISDAAAAQVGGLGIAPGANIGDGVICCEATHGTAPKYADKDVINPGSVILSGVIMFEWMGGEWAKVGQIIKNAIRETIKQGKVTYDLHRMMVAEGRADAQKLKTSEFAAAIIANMKAV